MSLLLSAVASLAIADRVWVKGVEIDQVGVFTGKSGGSSYHVVYVKSEGLKNNVIECPPTLEHGVVSMLKDSGDFNNNYQMRYSTLLSAQAQGLKVDLYIDDSNCNTSDYYQKEGVPYGRGAFLVGVLIAP